MASSGTRQQAYWQSVRFVSLGIGWALSTAALFAGSGARALEPRLRMSGYQTHQLYVGRLLALWAVGLVVALPYWVLVHFDLPQVRSGAMALILLLTVAVSAPFGLALSALLPRAGTEHLVRGAVHAGVVLSLLFVVLIVANGTRLRRRGHMPAA